MTTRHTGHNQTKPSLSITSASAAVMSWQIREPITDVRACAGARTRRRARPQGAGIKLFISISRDRPLGLRGQRLESQPLSAYNQNTTKRRINAPDWWSQQTRASEWWKRRGCGDISSHIQSNCFPVQKIWGIKTATFFCVPSLSRRTEEQTSNGGRTGQVRGQLKLRLQRTHPVLD